MEPRLSLKMTQRLVLTPTLQQAIKLLQYSRQELVQYVHQELLENPTLEEKVQEDEAVQEPVSEQAPEETAAGEGGDVADAAAGEVEPEWSEFMSEFDNGYEPYQPQEAPSYENMLSEGASLQSHLLQQVQVSFDEPEEKLIAWEIVGNIDDSGYFRSTVEEIAAGVDTSPDRVEAVLDVIHEFEPAGVGARDLAECLLVQLRGRGLDGGLEESIVRYHLRDLEARKLKKIARDQKTTIEDVVDAARVIASLEPNPGRSFASEAVQYIVPDINIYKVGTEYHVQLVEEGLPQLKINNLYRRLRRSGSLSATDKEFLEKKFNSARWLIKSILQRQQTILKVSKSIVKFQRDFLDHGIKYLKPLVLRSVAEDIDMHESTVSRVTNKKYAQTPQGLLELKFFFNSGIGRRGGESMASVSVMNLIRRLIEEEDPAKPLSDLELVRRLQEEHGLDIARRTVAKYRGILNIMPASRRKQVY